MHLSIQSAQRAQHAFRRYEEARHLRTEVQHATTRVDLIDAVTELLRQAPDLRPVRAALVSAAEAQVAFRRAELEGLGIAVEGEE